MDFDVLFNTPRHQKLIKNSDITPNFFSAGLPDWYVEYATYIRDFEGKPSSSLNAAVLNMYFPALCARGAFSSFKNVDLSTIDVEPLIFGSNGSISEYEYVFLLHCLLLHALMNNSIASLLFFQVFELNNRFSSDVSADLANFLAIFFINHDNNFDIPFHTIMKFIKEDRVLLFLYAYHKTKSLHKFFRSFTDRKKCASADINVLRAIALLQLPFDYNLSFRGKHLPRDGTITTIINVRDVFCTVGPRVIRELLMLRCTDDLFKVAHIVMTVAYLFSDDPSFQPIIDSLDSMCELCVQVARREPNDVYAVPPSSIYDALLRFNNLTRPAQWDVLHRQLTKRRHAIDTGDKWATLKFMLHKLIEQCGSHPMLLLYRLVIAADEDDFTVLASTLETIVQLCAGTSIFSHFFFFSYPMPHCFLDRNRPKEARIAFLSHAIFTAMSCFIKRGAISDLNAKNFGALWEMHTRSKDLSDDPLRDLIATFAGDKTALTRLTSSFSRMNPYQAFQYGAALTVLDASFGLACCPYLDEEHKFFEMYLNFVLDNTPEVNELLEAKLKQVPLLPDCFLKTHLPKCK
ncbi:hypothetical protein PCE1_002250 [Barthelona sp. PCE]